MNAEAKGEQLFDLLTSRGGIGVCRNPGQETQVGIPAGVRGSTTHIYAELGSGMAAVCVEMIRQIIERGGKVVCIAPATGCACIGSRVRKERLIRNAANVPRFDPSSDAMVEESDGESGSRTRHIAPKERVTGEVRE